MTSHETEDEEKKRVRYLKIRLPSRATAAKEEATRRRRRQTKAPRVSSFRRGHERTRTGGKKPRQRPPAGAAGARAPPSRPRRSPADAPRHRARERERGEGESRDGGGGQHATTLGERERDRWGEEGTKGAEAQVAGGAARPRKRRREETMGVFFLRFWMGRGRSCKIFVWMVISGDVAEPCPGKQFQVTWPISPARVSGACM